MIVVEKTTDFYKSPSYYTKLEELVAIKDSKTHKIKSILIPEFLVEKYQYLLQEEMKASLLKSFVAPVPQELEESFGVDTQSL
ncbi:MAG: hypothetical protein KU37_02925 [Sulfuricurvum sp. PC08-66]|nr:MAG: hypothetical protein KU37_02925 [Sulfuricurvum sp. PC08-66]